MFKPSDATPESKLPVLIYIQGGGYAAMGNSNYNGTELIQSSGGNMVVVMFNYRVGVLGFLSSENFGPDADLNVGLLDQRQLFLWVQKHISKVGWRDIPRTSTDAHNYCSFSSVAIQGMLSFKAPQLEVALYPITSRPTEAAIRRTFSSEQFLRVRFGPHFELSRKWSFNINSFWDRLAARP